MTEKPNIYVCTTAYDPFIGGAEIAIQSVVTRLSSRFSFFVITARLRKDLPDREERNGVTILRVGFGYPVLDKFILPVGALVTLLRQFRKNPPALFWCVMVSYGAGAAYLWNLIPFCRRVPIVLTLQEGDSPRHLRRGKLGFLGLSWWAALSWFPPEAVTGLSRYLCRRAKEVGYPGEPVVVPNGVDLGLFGGKPARDAKTRLRKELGIPPDAKLIISTSRLVQKNALDVLIASLTHTASNVYLAIIGEGPQRESLEQLITSHRLEARVFLLGERPNQELPGYLHGADIFVRVSRSEGQGISFIEAMAAQVPVIATPVGGIVDFLHDRVTGLLVPPDSPKELGEKIEELLRDVALSERLILAARASVTKTYSWDSISEEYARIFRATLGQYRLLIATGIYPPDVGGTASIAATLVAHFKGKSWNPEVISYGHPTMGVTRVSRGYPSGVRHLSAFFLALAKLFRKDGALLLDHFSIGFPVALAACLLRKPYAVRVGGDFLWESYVESRRMMLTLPDFYQKIPRLTLKERLIMRLTRFTLQNARQVAFTTGWQRDIFVKAYGIMPSRAVIIENPYFLREKENGAGRRELVYAGRFIYLKNLERLITALRDIPELSLTLIGEGSERERLLRRIAYEGLEARVRIESSSGRDRVLERVATARAVVIPSVSDISPNLALEALASGTPVILTRYSGYPWGRESGVLRVEPDDTASLREALHEVAETASYERLRKNAEKFRCPFGKQEWQAAYDSLIRNTL